jgi:hypothetical protein
MKALAARSSAGVADGYRYAVLVKYCLSRSEYPEMNTPCRVDDIRVRGTIASADLRVEPLRMG